MNHEELLHQLAKALSRIAESLPRKDLTLVLYPTQQMKMAVSHLYAQLIRFMLRATRWFKRGKLMHCFGAIARPFGLDFKDDIEKVDEVSRNIDELASAAAKAELRDTHLEMLETRAELREARTEIHRLGELVKAEAYRMLGVASSEYASLILYALLTFPLGTLSLTSQLKLDISTQKVHDLHCTAEPNSFSTFHERLAHIWGELQLLFLAQTSATTTRPPLTKRNELTANLRFRSRNIDRHYADPFSTASERLHRRLDRPHPCQPSARDMGAPLPQLLGPDI